MKINLVCVGDLKEKFFYDAQKEYEKRLKKFCEVKIIEIKQEKLSSNLASKEIEESLNKEYKNILKYLKGEVIVLAVEGEEKTSEQFSNLIKESFLKSSTITFVIGGSYGLSKELKKDKRLLSFSKLTFPHHIMRIVLLEQIYRAFTILNNITYHK